MGAVVNSKFGLGLLEVAANGLLAEFEQLRDFADLVPDRQHPEYGKLSRRQCGAPTDRANLRSNKILQANGTESCSHEKDRALLFRQAATARFATNS